MEEKKFDKKKALYWLIGGLAVLLAGVIVAAVMISGKGGEENLRPSTEDTAAQTTQGTDPSEVTEGTDPTEAKKPTESTGATEPATGSNEKPDEGQHGDEPDPTEAEPDPEPVTPVVTQPTEPTEPKEPTVGVDTETNPPKPDNVIDFDDLLNAGKTNG